MLGLGRASQYAGWWSGGPAVVTMNTVSTLDYAVEQTPSFSWLNTPSTSTTPVQGYPGKEAGFAPGNISVSDVPSLTGYNNNNWTQVITFAISYPTSGLSPNDGYKYDQKFEGSGGNFTGNFAWVLSNTGNRLQINWPGTNSITLPATNYYDYNDRWLTLVVSFSNTTSSFSNWTGTGTGTYYYRMLVVDTETGEKIAQADAPQSSRPFGMPADFSTWISAASGNISTVRGSSYSYSIGFASGGFPNDNLRLAGYWVSFGTMFDPLTVTDTSWRTTRPSAQIGNASAWLNCQFAGVGNTASYVTAWSTASGMDRFTPTTAGEQMTLIEYLGNSTIFNDRYSSTNKPISRG